MDHPTLPDRFYTCPKVDGAPQVDRAEGAGDDLADACFEARRRQEQVGGLLVVVDRVNDRIVAEIRGDRVGNLY